MVPMPKLQNKLSTKSSRSVLTGATVMLIEQIAERAPIDVTAGPAVIAMSGAEVIAMNDAEVIAMSGVDMTGVMTAAQTDIVSATM